jgi:gamma-glutamylcyclotransferase (GGCT)/AIG2-like uncharacterized protein YtfP
VGKTILFFYGSLKRGLSNHHRIAGQHHLGDAVTQPCYRIIEIGEYGGMIRDETNGFAVQGELWSVDAKCLSELDEFESGEGHWKRVPVAVVGHSEVQSYCWVGKVPEGARSGNIWPFA